MRPESGTSVTFRVDLARRIPSPHDAPPELKGVETTILRVRAKDVPRGIPTDANPRDPNLNRLVYKRVKESLRAEEADAEGAFHLKHGGIVIVADAVKLLDKDAGMYRVDFDPEVKQGIVNGGHSYALIQQEQDSGQVPDNQYIELKIHTGVPGDVIPDLADGLNTSLQVRDESLADLREQFEWLKVALGTKPGIVENTVSWHENDPGDYDVREVIAFLMALDPTRYSIEDPVGLENVYARVSSVFRQYLNDPAKVERFAPIALEALELYEFIRITSPKLWQGKFRLLKMADENKANPWAFPFLPHIKGKVQTADLRLPKAGAVPCFAAFRTLVVVPDDERKPVAWRYPFDEVLDMWTENGDAMLREVKDAVDQKGTTHYAGRSPALYRATTRTLELADLRRRVASE